MRSDKPSDDSPKPMPDQSRDLPPEGAPAPPAPDGPTPDAPASDSPAPETPLPDADAPDSPAPPPEAMTPDAPAPEEEAPDTPSPPLQEDQAAEDLSASDPDSPEHAPAEAAPAEQGQEAAQMTAAEEPAPEAEDAPPAPRALTLPPGTLPPDAPVPPISRPACAAALFGKLPLRGDFITRNMPRALQRPFEDWLIPLVQETRKELGAEWTGHWRSAGPWRFWIGADVLGGSWQRDLRRAGHEPVVQGGAITGVLLPSADRHGRDFPLVVVLADALARLMPPPVTTPPDRGWYDLCDDLLYAARAGQQDIAAIEAALDHLPGPVLPEGAEEMAPLLEQRALWAQSPERAEDGTGRIWHDIALADHHLAASHRSYWWQAPRAGAAQRVLTLAGLPDAGSFAFMLAQGHPNAPAPS